MISTGDVVPGYPYLWRWQQDKGEDAGRKDRPVCIAIASKDRQGFTHLALLAISGTPPRPDQTAIELPPLEIRRIGLRSDKQAWITVSEYNYDILEQSFSLEISGQPLKRLSHGFMRTVLVAFRATLAVSQARVDRL